MRVTPRGRCALTSGFAGRSPIYLDVQPNGHDEVPEAGVLGPGLDQARPKRADQLEEQLLRLGALQPLPEELRVEADLERLAGKGHRQRLARLAHVGSLRRHVECAL